MDEPNAEATPDADESRAELERHFPHVVRRLVACWNDADILESYLNSLVVEDRPGRAGFPPEAFAEIIFLADLAWRRQHFSNDGIRISPDGFNFSTF